MADVVDRCDQLVGVGVDDLHGVGAFEHGKEIIAQRAEVEGYGAITVVEIITPAHIFLRGFAAGELHDRQHRTHG